MSFIDTNQQIRSKALTEANLSWGYIIAASDRDLPNEPFEYTVIKTAIVYEEYIRHGVGNSEEEKAKA